MYENTHISKSIADIVKISTDLKSTLNFAYIRTIFGNINILSIVDNLIPNHHLKWTQGLNIHMLGGTYIKLKLKL